MVAEAGEAVSGVGAEGELEELVGFAIETTNTAGAGSLTYDAATGTYNYVWKTEASWAGTCRTFNLVLDDGTPHRAVFRFVR